MSLFMVNGIRTLCQWINGLNKGFGSNLRIDSRVGQEISEEALRTHRLKRCEYNDKKENNRPNTLKDENSQVSSHKFRQKLND